MLSITLPVSTCSRAAVPPVIASGRRMASSTTSQAGRRMRATLFQHSQSSTGVWVTHQATRAEDLASLLPQWGQRSPRGTSS